MKKKLFIFLILLLLVTGITGCKKKEENQGKLIEICELELKDLLLNEKNIILAVLDSDSMYYEDYLEQLNTVSKNAKLTIYYVDILHLNLEPQIYLYEGMSLTEGQTYSVIKDNEVVMSKTFSSTEDMMKDLRDYKFEDVRDEINEDELNEALENSSQYRSEGKMSSALYELNKIWTTKEAQEIVEYDPYYKLPKVWDYNGIKDNILDYKLIYFDTTEDQIGLFNSVTEVDEFEKPTFNDLTYYNYYLNDDIIMIKVDDKKFIEYATIKYISDTQLVLDKDGKEYIYLLTR